MPDTKDDGSTEKPEVIIEGMTPLSGGGSAPRKKPARADFRKWAPRDLWHIAEATMLILGFKPFEVNAHSWSRPEGFDDIYDTASRSIAAGTLRATPRHYVRPRDFLAWAHEKGYRIPLKLEEAVNRFHPKAEGKRAHNGNRTAPATAKRGANKRDRVADLKDYIDDVYESANQGDFDLGSGNNRKALPFSADDLHTLFRVRHPEHRVTRDTFSEDLGSIGVKLKSGTKRLGLKEIAEMLAGKFSG